MVINKTKILFFTSVFLITLSCCVKDGALLIHESSMTYYTLKPCKDVDLYVDNNFIGKLIALDTRPSKFSNTPAGAITRIYKDNKNVHSVYTTYKSGKWTWTSDIRYFVNDSASSDFQSMELYDYK